MQTQTHNGSTLELVWALWRRRKWLAIVASAAGFLAVASLVYALPDLYRASSTVLVKQEEVSEEFVRSSVADQLESRLHTVGERILSRARLQELINRFGLYPELGKRASSEMLIERMRRDIHIEQEEVRQRWGRGAIVAFTLSYQGWDPRTVAKVTNTLASMYIEENEKLRESQAIATKEFLEKRLEEIKKDLNAQEQRIATFKERHAGELPDQQQANMAALERLNSQLHLNNENQRRARERRARLLDQLHAASASDSSGSSNGTAEQVAELKEDLAQLRTRFSERYPDVVQLKAEIAALENQQATSDGMDASQRIEEDLNAVESELEALKEEEQRLRESIANYEQRIEKAPKLEQRLQSLKRDYEMIKERHSSLLERYQDAQLAEAVERQRGEQFQVLDSAIVPSAPVAPQRVRLLLMGLILSFAVAGGFVVLVEQIDTSFHTVEELHAFTSVPILATIPRIVTRADVWRRRLRHCVVILAVALGLVLVVWGGYRLGDGNEHLVWMLALRSA